MENIMVDAVDWGHFDAPASALGPPTKVLKRPRRESPPGIPGPSSVPKTILRDSNKGRDDRTRLPSDRSFGSHTSIIAPPSRRPAYVPISSDQLLNPSSSRSSAAPPPRGLMRRLNCSPYTIPVVNQKAPSSPSSRLLRARLAEAAAALPNPPPSETYEAHPTTASLRRSGRLSSARDRSTSISSAYSDEESSSISPPRRLTPKPPPKQSRAAGTGPGQGRATRSSLRSAHPACGIPGGLLPIELPDENENEAEYSDLISEDGSEDSDVTESSMEWQDDEELGDAEEDIAESESDSDGSSSGWGGVSIMDLPLRAVDAKFQRLNRKLGRLQDVRKTARSAQRRAGRLDDHVSAERYTSALYRGLLRRTQTDLSETRMAKRDLEGRYRTINSARDSANRKLEMSETVVSSLRDQLQNAADRSKVEKEEWRVEREKLVAALQLAERARETREKEREATARLVADRYATVSNEKEAVERRRDALEVELRDAQNAKVEGDRKLAMIREAHDFERTSYLDQIRALKDQLKVKVERGG